MSGLQQIQSDFQHYVLGGAGDPDGKPPAIAAAISEQFGLNAEQRLAIYYNSYRSRMREALSESFDKTWSYVGDDMFADLASSYLDAHPSEFRSLRWYGGQFAAHVAAELPDYPFVAELAAFEWSLGLAFDASDVAPLNAGDLSMVAPDEWAGLRFGLHPSVQLLALHWNAVALWQTLGEDMTPPDALESAEATCWLVWRTAGQPHFRSLSPLEFAALDGIRQGQSFGEICDLANGDGELVLRLAGFLQTWLAQEMLIKP
ncbi:HvfC/BufC N-terminal domain-containing protein [Janthinobacterium agaricidamnosum]|uniref:Putative DNA-binding domain-containing protein n=1 Tax=Janthinobacterium agaricidamnosum NBRC 102515 = DSM 9628 TaxID=1349767 RepID=W0UWR0_9BURK|nr:putative DNA-binding domain-containing protein [Janthinobacterium agaricidamnosum]CDG80869.1 hypothetical protein GJA_206 [Janthinobacterium agaricidamnosum NBRC 102515 = DSM 9628]